MIDRERLRELVARMCAPGRAFAQLSASEGHEIVDGVLALLDGESPRDEAPFRHGLNKGRVLCGDDDADEDLITDSENYNCPGCVAAAAHLLRQHERAARRADGLNERVRLAERQVGMMKKSVAGLEEELEGARQVRQRERLPAERVSVVRRFKIPVQVETVQCPGCGQAFDLQGTATKMYVTVGLYPDGRPGELFVRADKAGGLLAGMLDNFAIAASLALQHGASIDDLANKLVGQAFPPAGFTGDAEYKTATSVMDLLGRWLRDKFGKKTEGENV